MPNERPPNELGKRLLEAAEDIGISQNQIANRVSEILGREVQGGYVSKLKTGDRGDRIAPEMLFAIAEVLQVEPQWLWLGKGPKRDALVERYRDMRDEVRKRIQALKEAGVSVAKSGKLAKLEDDLARAYQQQKDNAAHRERERQALRPTGTHGRRQ